LTHINGEPVKLVEAFDELRPGMVVWLGPCPDHGHFERTMVTGLTWGGDRRRRIQRREPDDHALGYLPSPARS